MISMPDRDMGEPGLSGRTLTIARIAWFLTMAMGLLVLAIAIPGYVAHYVFLQGVDLGEFANISTTLALIIHILTGAISLFGSLAGFVMAALLFRRAQESRMAYFISLFLIAYCTYITGPLEAARAILIGPEEIVFPINVFDYLILVIAWLFWLFPNGRFVPRWTGYMVLPSLVIVFAATVTNSSSYDLSPSSTNFERFYSAFFLLLWLSALIAQAYRYWRVSNRLERQQTKWVMVGICLWIAVIILAGVVAGDTPFAGLLWFLGLVLLPTSLTISILRYRLWDIDLIIRRTVMYTLITALLAGVYFGAVTLLQSAFTGLIGSASPLALVISTLAIAALFNPLRRRIQEVVDRRFNRRRYDAQKTLEAFAEAMHDEVDMDRLSTTLVNVVEETMQPESVGLWLAASSVNTHKDQRATSL